MRVYVNDEPIELGPSMTVRHALLAAGIGPKPIEGLTVKDEWGHVVGLDGALSEGYRLFVQLPGPMSGP